ncbi:MAG: sulfatase-like hydrolase/transferase [Verrucomicrobia bacterium]|nr:sulfatase-like hydrolase/transferase [Verrucomicrobiota bacterium]
MQPVRRFGVLLCLLAVALAPAAEPARPNVVVILADDLGYGDMSAYRPGADIRTPNLDRFAAEGMRFTRMRANATVCSPTRAALMSGRYADRVGVPGLIRTEPANTWGYFDPKVPTLANHLHAAGYHTAIVGKWNLGLTAPGTPNDRGFDLFHGFLDDMMDSYTTHLRQGHNYMRLNREVVDPAGHATDIFTAWAQEYLRERAAAKSPFFLYLAYNAPHFPMEPPAEWLARVKARQPGIEEKRALNVALVEHLDACVGQVLATLKETGLERSTLVIFTSDNGGSLPHAQNNDPWRDGKQSHYDGGLRIPFAARWPGTIAPGTLNDYAGLTFDIFATALEAAGVPRPADSDAVSLLPMLRGGPAPAGVRELYFVRREGGPAYGGKSYEAIIRGDWKLLQNSPYSPLELYNLKDDPQEKTDLFAKNPKIARELQAALRLHVQRGGGTPWEPPSR